jgi:double-strand break repair protein MRE11
LRALEDEFGDDPNQPQCKYTIKNPERVLVRLKVEHTGFTTLNNQRFGSQFVGQVANPSDILLFHKRRGGESAKGGKATASRKKRSTAGLDVPVEPEDLEQINIEDLIVQNLANNEKKLELLDEKSMGEALEQYVDKKEARAIATMAEKMLNLSQKTLMKRARAGAENGDGGGTAMDNPTAVREVLSGITGKKRADYDVEMEEAAEEKKKKAGMKSTNGKAVAGNGAKKRSSSKDDDSLSDEEEEERPTKKKPRVATTSKKTTAKSKPKYDDSDEDDFEDDDDPPPPKKRATAAKKARSRDDDDSDSDIEVVETQVPSKPARSARTTAKKPPKYNYDNDDSDVEEIDDSEVEETPKPTARGKKGAASTGTAKARAPSQTQSTLTTFTSTRKPSAATSRGNGRAVQYLESDSDDEPSRGGGGEWGSASQSTKGRARR